MCRRTSNDRQWRANVEKKKWGTYAMEWNEIIDIWTNVRRLLLDVNACASVCHICCEQDSQQISFQLNFDICWEWIYWFQSRSDRAIATTMKHIISFIIAVRDQGCIQRYFVYFSPVLCKIRVIRLISVCVCCRLQHVIRGRDAHICRGRGTHQPSIDRLMTVRLQWVESNSEIVSVGNKTITMATTTGGWMEWLELSPRPEMTRNKYA